MPMIWMMWFNDDCDDEGNDHHDDDDNDDDDECEQLCDLDTYHTNLKLQ